MSEDTSLRAKLSLSENSVNFLLAEFGTSIDQWQSMHDRLDKEVQYYFALVGALIAAGGLIIQIRVVNSFLFPLGVVHLFCLISAIAGYRLLRRIAHLTYLMALLSGQVGLIRRSFVELDHPLALSIILTTASSDRSAHDFPPIAHSLSIRIVSFINSVLAAALIFLIPFYIFLYAGIAYPDVVWMAALVVAAVCGIGFGVAVFRHQNDKIILPRDKEMEQVTKMVQERVRALTEPAS